MISEGYKHIALVEIDLKVQAAGFVWMLDLRQIGAGYSSSMRGSCQSAPYLHREQNMLTDNDLLVQTQRQLVLPRARERKGTNSFHF